jgi:quercetin dioxygenase-like cupin family protein
LGVHRIVPRQHNIGKPGKKEGGIGKDEKIMKAPVFARPKEKVSFDPKRFVATPLFECPEMKVIRATFQAGQFIPVHMPDVHVVLYILSGEGEVVAGEKRHRVREGDLVVVPRKVARGVKAKTDMVVLHVVSPLPTEADHGDMAARIARGDFELPA